MYKSFNAMQRLATFFGKQCFSVDNDKIAFAKIDEQTFSK